VFRVGADQDSVAVVSDTDEQVRLYVVATEIGPTDRDPEVATAPLHLESIGLDAAIQLAAPLVDHVSVGVTGLIVPLTDDVNTMLGAIWANTLVGLADASITHTNTKNIFFIVLSPYRN
jgi:hypothetical protein